jgi:hypothetical protein
MPAPKRLVWSTFAGGTSAAEGKHGYSVNTEVGEYHISPVSTQSGRHRGYVARFANTQGLPGFTGLWSGIGENGEPLSLHAERIYRSPNAAKKAARLHYEAVTAMLQGRGITLNPYSRKARYRHKRLVSPKRFVRGSFRLTRAKRGVRVVVGQLKGERRRVARGRRRGRKVLTAQSVLTRKRGRNPAEMSERQAFQYIGGRLLYIMRHSHGDVHDQAQAAAAVLARVAEQVHRGVHVNPTLAVFGANPPHKVGELSRDVQAILYRHAADGRDYVHPFGQGVKVGNKRDGSTVVRAGRTARSGVRAIVLSDGSVLLRHPSKPIWRDL